MLPTRGSLSPKSKIIHAQNRLPGRFASGIATLTLMVALGQMAVGMVIPSLPALADYLQTDMGTVQLTLTVHFTAFAFFQLLAGPLSDRFGRRPVI